MVLRILVVLVACAGASAAAGVEGEITFHRDVQPVLRESCWECHRPGEAAPMSLLTYEEARPWAAAIREAVLTKKMPPWFADPAHGEFSNDRRLSEAKIAVLTKWADSGAKEGDPADAPEPPRFEQGWEIGEPDLVLDMGFDYEVPAAGEVPYTYFVVPTGLTEDKWIESVEARPGARSVVHHIVVTSSPADTKRPEGFRPGNPFVPEKGKPGERKADSGEGTLVGLGQDEILATFVPGGVAYRTRPGEARLLPAGRDLIFQMHYTPNGRATVDRSVVGIKFAERPPQRRVVNTFISNTRLSVPPGASHHRVDARVKIHEDVDLLSFFPHMHLRGKAFEYQAILPSGERKTLLKVPRYDFNWQLTYYLEEPLHVPKGTELLATAWYDNSANNPYNPDPTETVYWGDQTWEEMLVGFVDFSIPVDADPARIAGPEKKNEQVTENPAPAGSGSE